MLGKVLAGFLLLQIASSPSNETGVQDVYSLSLIKSALEQPAGIRVSFLEKRLNRLGDAVSISLLKTLDDQKLSEPKTAERVLMLVQSAFSSPTIISLKEDKDPRITMLFLDLLERKTRDPVLKRRIVETRFFVRKQVTTIVS